MQGSGGGSPQNKCVSTNATDLAFNVSKRLVALAFVKGRYLSGILDRNGKNGTHFMKKRIPVGIHTETDRI